MRFFILLLIFSLHHAHLNAQFREHLEEQIAKIIYYDTEIDHKNIPGYLIGVQMGDSTYVYSYGTTTKDSTHLPDETTIFEIGGLTKVFTASLVKVLADEAILNLDSTLNSYLPEKDRSPFANKITVRDLVQHTSGFPRLPMEFGVKEKELNNPYAHYTNKDLIHFYKNWYVEEKEKPVYAYSHVNYALLEYLIEQVTQQKFEEVLKEKLLTPLQMEDTRIEQLNAEQVSRMAQGYAISGNPTPSWRFQSFRASEGLKSTVEDLLKFTQVNLGMNHADLAKTMEETHQPFVDTKMRQDTYSGFGWHIMKMRRYHDVILHAGATNGHRAFLGFVKENNTGVVVLSNSEYGTNGLGILILRMINYNWKKKKKG